MLSTRPLNHSILGIKIPEDPVEIYHCGGHGGGWLNGQHPQEKDEIVETMVCFNYICSWNIMIRVANCGDYYLYDLPETQCDGTYCAE